jgi:hypothetical protein
MKHEMDDEEYSQYLSDMQELDQLRRVKANFSRDARRWFDNIEFWFGKDSSLKPDKMYSHVAGCAKEEADGCEYYCDFCPFPDIFGCPFGYEVSYSK